MPGIEVKPLPIGAYRAEHQEGTGNQRLKQKKRKQNKTINEITTNISLTRLVTKEIHEIKSEYI